MAWTNVEIDDTFIPAGSGNEASCVPGTPDAPNGSGFSVSLIQNDSSPYPYGVFTCPSGGAAFTQLGTGLEPPDELEWLELSPAASPSDRHNAASCRTSVTGASFALLVFGGDDGALNDETWAWYRNNWHQLAPASKPSARSGARMVLGYLFGGDDGAASSQTWQWNGTNNWIHLQTPTTPPARYNHAFFAGVVVDGFSSKGLVPILFGGNSGAGLLNDIWYLSGQKNGFSGHATNGSPTFSDTGVNFAASDVGMTIVIRGVPYLISALVSLHVVTLSTNYAGTTTTTATSRTAGDWKALTTANAAPSTRELMTVGFFGPMFGGVDGGAVLLDETHTWDSTATAGQSNGFVLESPAAAPSPRTGATIISEALTDTLLFGGDDGSLQNDLWSWDGSDWTDLTGTITGGPPAARSLCVFGPDYSTFRTPLLFGGDAGGSELGDTWIVGSYGLNECSDCGISQQLAYVDDELWFAWRTGIGRAPLVRKWDGAAWVNVGDGGGNNSQMDTLAGLARNPSIAGGFILFNREDGGVDHWEVWQFDAGNWVQLDPGSTALNQIEANSVQPTLAVDPTDGFPVVAAISSDAEGSLYKYDGAIFNRVGGTSALPGAFNENFNGSYVWPIATATALGVAVTQRNNYTDLGPSVAFWDGAAWSTPVEADPADAALFSYTADAGDNPRGGSVWVRDDVVFCAVSWLSTGDMGTTSTVQVITIPVGGSAWTPLGTPPANLVMEADSEFGGDTDYSAPIVAVNGSSIGFVFAAGDSGGPGDPGSADVYRFWTEPIGGPSLHGRFRIT